MILLLSISQVFLSAALMLNFLQIERNEQKIETLIDHVCEDSAFEYGRGMDNNIERYKMYKSNCKDSYK